jgi:hypothetical protein
MFHHSKSLRVVGWDHHGPDQILARATADALREVGNESLVLWDRMLDNTEAMLSNAGTHKDATDVCQTMSAFLNASYRDVGENAEAVSRIWRRYFREAAALIATSPASLPAFASRSV